MFNEFFNIIKKGATLSICNIGMAGVQFLLLPVYTRILIPSDFGVLELMTIYSSMLSLIMMFGIRQGFTKNYLLKDKEIDSYKNSKWKIKDKIIGDYKNIKSVDTQYIFPPEIKNIINSSRNIFIINNITKIKFHFSKPYLEEDLLYSDQYGVSSETKGITNNFKFQDDFFSILKLERLSKN